MFWNSAKRAVSCSDSFIKRSDLEQIKTQNSSNSGKIKIKDRFFHYHHAGSFYDTYKEIFEEKIYQFTANNNSPVIIDCGSNMGLSVLYFAGIYPNSKIIAFEPDRDIFELLKKNVECFDIQNVSIHNKAVWDSKTTLKFYTDNGMGGSVTNKFLDQKPQLVETEILADYLQEKIDFLKIDIEGAEYQVLKSCSHLLKNVENIFVEYHSFINEEQHLDDLLQLLKENGFRYHLKQSFSRPHPFDDNVLACENMDMAINVFAYKDKLSLNDLYFDNNKIIDSQKPLVSICIPVYNGQEYIKTAIDSALNQSYSAIEILIVDDGSTDNSIKIAEQYLAEHKNIKIYKNDKNQGLVGNWKKCIEYAKGDWIKFLFQDDFMEPRCVEKMITACHNNNLKFALCARGFIFEDNVSDKIKNTFINELLKPENIFINGSIFSPFETAKLISMHLTENVLGEPICTLFHKSLYYSVGGFNDKINQLVDYEFALKIVLNNSFAFLKEKLVHFRVHMDSTTSKNVHQSPHSKKIRDGVIRSTTGDYLVLLDLYLNDKMFLSIRNKVGEDKLILIQKYIYLRACRYNGKKRVDTLLSYIVKHNKILSNCSYNRIKYKIFKWKQKKVVKEILG